MLIPVFVILLFSVTVFQPSFSGINFYGRNQLKACATLGRIDYNYIDLCLVLLISIREWYILNVKLKLEFLEARV